MVTRLMDRLITGEAMDKRTWPLLARLAGSLALGVFYVLGFVIGLVFVAFWIVAIAIVAILAAIEAGVVDAFSRRPKRGDHAS